jgi:hypothetical protein
MKQRAGAPAAPLPVTISVMTALEARSDGILPSTP